MLNFLFFSPYLLLPPPTVALAGLSANRIGDFPTVTAKSLRHCPWGLERPTVPPNPFTAWQLSLSSLALGFVEGD